jgi:hypothetical protein
MIGGEHVLHRNRTIVNGNTMANVQNVNILSPESRNPASGQKDWGDHVAYFCGRQN